MLLLARARKQASGLTHLLPISPALVPRPRRVQPTGSCHMSLPFWVPLPHSSPRPHRSLSAGPLPTVHLQSICHTIICEDPLAVLCPLLQQPALWLQPAHRRPPRTASRPICVSSTCSAFRLEDNPLQADPSLLQALLTQRAWGPAHSLPAQPLLHGLRRAFRRARSWGQGSHCGTYLLEGLQ